MAVSVLSQRCQLSDVQHIKIKIKDYDAVGGDDDLGEVILNLQELFPDGDREVSSLACVHVPSHARSRVRYSP